MLRRIVMLFALSSLLLAACSSGGGDEASSGGDTGGATGGTSASGETASGETGGGMTTGTTGGAGSIDAAQCAEVAAAMSEAAQSMPDVFTGNTADLDQSLEQLRAFAEAAPEEIRADLQTVVEGYAKIVEALQQAGYDPASGQAPPPEVVAALTQASQELDSQEFKDASDRVSAYFASCNGG
jgi:hypothetical protein